MTQNGMNNELERRLATSPRMTASGLICCHSGFDFGHMAALCFSQGDCLCVRHSCCLAAGIESRGCGMTTKPEHKECCKVGLYCCDCGLVTPQVCCAESSQFLCCYNSQSLPFNKEHLDSPVCAAFCLQCLPTLGCCASPGECKALDHIIKNRNLDIYPGTMPAGAAATAPATIAMERK